MHNVCCLTAPPRSSFLWKKSALGLARHKKKAHGSLLKQDPAQGNSFSCADSAAVNLDLEFIWFQTCLHRTAWYSSQPPGSPVVLD